MDFKLINEFIELDNLLKVSGVASSGPGAKEMIKNMAVRVNGGVEIRVRRKLKSGDVVLVNGEEIRIV